jgi:hypothetical protein
LDSSTSSSELSDSARREFFLSNDTADQSRTGQRLSLSDRAKQNDNLISHLQRLSNAVRAASGEVRAAKVNAWWYSLSTSTTPQNQDDQVRNASSYVQDVQAFKSYAEMLLRVRFPSSEPWLRTRVLNSMTYRRVRCLYLMAKDSSVRVKLNVQDPGLKEMAAPELVAKVPQTPHRTAVKFETEETGKSDYHAVVKPASNVSRVNKSAFRKPPTTIVSTKTSFSSANDEMISIPPCPENPSSNKDFTCPYCNFILPSSEALPSKWKYVYCPIPKLLSEF